MPREYVETNQVEMSARVSKELYDEFIGLFPQHGASSWLIRTALEQFLEEVRKEPSTIERLREAIRESIRTA